MARSLLFFGSRRNGTMKQMVTRFTASERWFHNIVMVSFILLLITGLGMLYFNLLGEQEGSRAFLVTVHECIAIVFLIGPILAMLRGDKKVWRENVQILTHWCCNDFVWLLKKPLTPLFRDIELPEDDKFNPGQKTWATNAFSGAAILAISGVIMWTTGSPMLALAIHTAIAILMLCALTGHVFMALVNPDTAPGVGSIIDGEVELEWAQRHHPIWVERHARNRMLEKISAAQTEERNWSSNVSIKTTLSLMKRRESSPTVIDFSQAQRIKIPKR